MADAEAPSYLSRILPALVVQHPDWSLAEFWSVLQTRKDFPGDGSVSAKAARSAAKRFRDKRNRGNLGDFVPWENLGDDFLESTPEWQAVHQRMVSHLHKVSMRCAYGGKRKRARANNIGDFNSKSPIVLSIPQSSMATSAYLSISPFV